MSSLVDEQNDKVYLKDIAKINKDIEKIKSKAKKEQREIDEKTDIAALNDRKRSIESAKYEFGKVTGQLVPDKERKRTMSLKENNF